MKRALVSTSQLLRRANLPLRNLSTAAVSVNALKPGKECLLDIPHTNITLLNNGFKVASEDIGTPTCTVGIWIQSGSKYETADNNGISNLLEHVIFKGTNKRSAAEFEKAIVKLGAQLGVHTGREHTAIYARCLSRNADKVVELLADAVMNLNVKDEDVERQKPAILAQMKPKRVTNTPTL
jgi:predicted Zn-dependent peptidase